MYDVIRKDRVIGALTWLKQHNDHYRNIDINENWYSLVSDDELPQMLIQEGDPNAHFVKRHDIQEQSTHKAWTMKIVLKMKLCNNSASSTQMIELHIHDHSGIIKTIIMKILQN